MARSFESFEELKGFLKSSLAADTLPIVSLTPALAKDIQAHDPANRKIRKVHVTKLAREIKAGNWDPRKSTAMRFLENFRLADGQHRCAAVIEAEMAIQVPVCIVADTIGVDENANRTLADHLSVYHGYSDSDAPLAAAVTKALCEGFSHSNREYLMFFQNNEPFIKETIAKTNEWLSGMDAVTVKVFKPALVAVMRARAIRDSVESAEIVDRFWLNAINGGVTAPDGSLDREVSANYHSEMFKAFKSQKKLKTGSMYDWFLASLKCLNEGKVRNITSMSMNRKSRKKAA